MKADPTTPAAAQTAAARRGAGPDTTLIFLHIPKTGGVTIRRILTRQYPHKATLDVLRTQVGPDPTELFRGMPSGERARLRLIHGHIKFGVHRFFEQPTTYMTMLRDPMSQVVSEYYHILRTPRHPFHFTLRHKGLSLEQYLRSGLYEDASNRQTRLIAGDAVDRIEYGSKDPQALAAAKKNLTEHFASVGLTERFTESVLLMADSLGWGTPYYYRRNTARNKSDKSGRDEQVQSLIREYNQLDLELYKFARGLFEGALRARPGFDRKLRRFRMANASYGKVYAFGRDVLWYGRDAFNNM